MNCPHCNTPIDEHRADGCLDAWIAETVFGGRLELSKPWEAWDDPPRDRLVVTLLNGGRLYGSFRDWSPSSNITDAWEVILHFTPYGSFSFSLQRWHTDSGNWH